MDFSNKSDDLWQRIAELATMDEGQSPIDFVSKVFGCGMTAGKCFCLNKSVIVTLECKTGNLFIVLLNVI